MTKATIAAKLEAKREQLRVSQDDGVRFTLCGTRCRMHYGSDTAIHYGYKYPLMQGFAHVTFDELVNHIHRFQF